MGGAFVALVEPVGVDQRKRARKLAGAFVMVDHDDVEPGVARPRERFERHRAAIDGDDQARAFAPSSRTNASPLGP